MATETLPIHRPVNRNRERIFFGGMAILSNEIEGVNVIIKVVVRHVLVHMRR